MSVLVMSEALDQRPCLDQDWTRLPRINGQPAPGTVEIPSPGEYVSVSVAGQELRGMLVAVHPESRVVTLMRNGFGLTRHHLELEALRVPECLDSSQPALPPSPMLHAWIATAETLQAKSTSMDQMSLQIRAAEDRLESLVQDAHEWANDHDLCGRFDDFCEAHDLPTRTQSFDLRVRVTATVYLTREGRSLEDVMGDVTRDEVWSALESDQFEFDVEEDY